MEIKQWIINFKPSENIRELALLFTLFLFMFLGIFILATNNKNDKDTNPYSKYPTKEAYIKEMAALAAAAKAKEEENSTFVSSSNHSTENDGQTTTTPTTVVVQPVLQKATSTVVMAEPREAKVDTTSTTTTMPSILVFDEKETKDRNDDEIYTSSYGTTYVQLPIVIQSIPQSTRSQNFVPRLFSTSGWIDGITGEFEGKLLDVFLGVPYAEPPVKELRFRNPVKFARREHRLDCSSFKPHCLQKFNQFETELRTPLTATMSEDCLYLNIWRKRRPNQPTFSSTTKARPIMIWLFGGGFQGGSNNLDEFDGRVLAARGDVIVVTVNYRNGPLGYLDLGTSDVPGNQGLRDIVTAIDWVRDNAVNLNGNPGQITLFGQSSGSIAISLLMSNNEIASKVRRVILQSGSPLIPGKIFKRSLATSLRFTKALGCGKDGNMLSASSCLRSLSVEDLYKFYKSSSYKKFTFAPKHGDDLIPFLPEDLFFKKPEDVKSGKYFNANLDVMMGITSNESSIMLMLDFPEKFTKDRIRIKFNSIQGVEYFIEQEVGPSYGLTNDEAYLVFNTFFPSSSTPQSSDELMSSFLKLTSDLMFVCPSKLFAEKYGQLVRNSRIFFYEFAQRWKNHPLGEWVGITHGDDYPYVFGMPFRYPEKYTDEDREVSDFMISAWTSFARNGTPKSRNDFTNWPFFSSGKYMRISALNSAPSSPIIRDNLSQDTCDKFEKMYDELK